MWFDNSYILWGFDDDIYKKFGFGDLMLKENSAQISLEYLLVFAIYLIILVAFTLPLLEFEIENTLDVSNSLKIKSDLSKISNAISKVYSEGQGSKQTVFIKSDNSIRINVDKNLLYVNFKLNDDSNKKIKSNHNSNLLSSSINLKKGGNAITVEWPIGSENMIISS